MFFASKISTSDRTDARTERAQNHTQSRNTPTNAHQTNLTLTDTHTHTPALGERCQSTDDTARLTPTLTQPPRASTSAWGTIALLLRVLNTLLGTSTVVVVQLYDLGTAVRP